MSAHFFTDTLAPFFVKKFSVNIQVKILKALESINNENGKYSMVNINVFYLLQQLIKSLICWL